MDKEERIALAELLHAHLLLVSARMMTIATAGYPAHDSAVRSDNEAQDHYKEKFEAFIEVNGR